MKKLLETSLGKFSNTAFFYNDKRVMNIDKLPSILDSECNPYKTGSEGVVVYLSKKRI